MNLARPILDALRTRPDRCALVVTDARGNASGTYTQAELLAQTAGWQRRFAAEGLTTGDPVALSPSRTLNLPALHLAALACGLQVVPLNPALSEPERRHILETSGVRVAATSAHLLEQPRTTAKELGPQWLCEDEVAASAGALVQTVEVAGNAPALLLYYTSGTTGRAKSVPLSHDNLSANLRALEALWERGPGDRLLHVLPAHHFHGLVLGVYGTLLAA